jgi:hypothetical protein
MSSSGYPNHGIQIGDTKANPKYTQFDLKPVLYCTRRWWSGHQIAKLLISLKKCANSGGFPFRKRIAHASSTFIFKSFNNFPRYDVTTISIGLNNLKTCFILWSRKKIVWRSSVLSKYRHYFLKFIHFSFIYLYVGRKGGF